MSFVVTCLQKEEIKELLLSYNLERCPKNTFNQ